MFETPPSTPCLLTAAIGLPILAALSVWALGQSRQKASSIVAQEAALLPLLILGVAAFRLAPTSGFQLGDKLPFWPDLGLTWSLAVDGLSLPFALIAAALGAVGVSAARTPTERGFALLAQGIAILLFLSQDLFVFLAAWWALPLALYALITGWGRHRAEYAATKLLAMLLIGAAVMSVSLVAIYLVANGNGDMAALWMTKPGFPLEALNHWVLCGILGAAWVSAAQFPFHTWLEDSLEAAPPSAVPLLVGGLQAAGTYAFVRLAMGYFPSYLQPWMPWLAALGVFSALYALLASWGQRSLSRALALLSTACSGLVLVGLAALPLEDLATTFARALLLAFAALGSGGLLAWLTSELTFRAEPEALHLDRLGFLAPRGATWWAGIGVAGLVVVTLAGSFLLATLAGSRTGLMLASGLGLVGLLATGGTALRSALVSPVTPAQVDAVEDLGKRQLAFGWGSLLLAAIPAFWLIFGSRAIAVFASQLSLGFVR